MVLPRCFQRFLHDFVESGCVVQVQVVAGTFNNLQLHIHTVCLPILHNCWDSCIINSVVSLARRASTTSQTTMHTRMIKPIIVAKD